MVQYYDPYKESNMADVQHIENYFLAVNSALDCPIPGKIWNEKTESHANRRIVT